MELTTTAPYVPGRGELTPQPLTPEVAQCWLRYRPPASYACLVCGTSGVPWDQMCDGAHVIHLPPIHLQ